MLSKCYNYYLDYKGQRLMKVNPNNTIVKNPKKKKKAKP